MAGSSNRAALVLWIIFAMFLYLQQFDDSRIAFRGLDRRPVGSANGNIVRTFSRQLDRLLRFGRIVRRRRNLRARIARRLFKRRLFWARRNVWHQVTCIKDSRPLTIWSVRCSNVSKMRTD